MYIPFVSLFKHADNILSRLYSIPLHLAYILSRAPHSCRAPCLMRVRFCAYTGTFSFILRKWRNCKWKNFYDCAWITIIAARRRMLTRWESQIWKQTKRLPDVANVCIRLASRALKCFETVTFRDISRELHFVRVRFSNRFKSLLNTEANHRSFIDHISISEIN